jgi:hypothetical protein
MRTPYEEPKIACSKRQNWVMFGTKSFCTPCTKKTARLCTRAARYAITNEEKYCEDTRFYC